MHCNTLVRRTPYLQLPASACLLQIYESRGRWGGGAEIGTTPGPLKFDCQLHSLDPGTTLGKGKTDPTVCVILSTSGVQDFVVAELAPSQRSKARFFQNCSKSLESARAKVDGTERQWHRGRDAGRKEKERGEGASSGCYERGSGRGSALPVAVRRTVSTGGAGRAHPPPWAARCS